MVNSQTMSFYQLINKYKIIIPKIQRNYAQGRGDDKTKQIRNIFLENIFNALENNKSLNLDFIYGNIDEKDCFIPLDGQQRLTTLFLLYYYLVLRNGKNTNEPKFKNLNNFSYETRISSKDFMEKLVTNMDKRLIDSENNGKSIKENIKNQFWFFDEYLQDSTIAGMLTMLESIEEKCKNIEYEKLKQILENWCDENKCLVKFEFLHLKDFGLSDELYIKMNARGKVLSDFENFKAKFIEKLKEISYQNTMEEIAKKMDGDWLDLFWKLRKSNDEEMVKETDKRFLAFFQAVLILLGRKFFENKEKINVREIENYNALNFLPCLDKDKMIFIEKILDNLIILEKVNKPQEYFETITKHFKTIIGIEQGEDDGSKGKISAYDRENFYIDMLILSNDNFSFDNFENSNFAKFQRVAQNVVKNRLINNINDFLRILECIDELSKGLNSRDFYEFLKDFSPRTEREKEIRQQVDEEKYKASLILQSKEWENAIYEVEKHWYLNGQIGFLLYFANDDLDTFRKYFEAFDKVFPKGNEYEYNKQAIDFRQALLTKGIYFEMKKSKQYHSLYTFNPALRTKIDTWRKCFFDKSSLLKKLLDDIKNDKSIQNIIDEYLLDNTQSNDPQYYLIKYKEIWENYSYIRTPNTDGEFGNEIQFTKKLTTNGAIECYTYALYCELKNEPYLNIKYQYDNSSNTQKMGIFKNESNKLFVWGNVKDTEEWYFYIIDKDSTEITNQDQCISSSANNMSDKFQKAKEYLINFLNH